MLRQLYDALRTTIADFFNVPWQAVICLFVVIGLLIVHVFIRTNYSWNAYQWLEVGLFAGIFVALAVAGKCLTRR